MSAAELWSPPSVPRSVMVPSSQRKAWFLQSPATDHFLDLSPELVFHGSLHLVGGPGNGVLATCHVKLGKLYRLPFFYLIMTKDKATKAKWKQVPEDLVKSFDEAIANLEGVESVRCSAIHASMATCSLDVCDV